MINFKHTVLYIGSAINLEKRLWEHKTKVIKGFTNRYHVHILVYFEEYIDIIEAVKRERQLKNGREDGRKN